MVSDYHYKLESRNHQTALEKQFLKNDYESSFKLFSSAEPGFH